MAAIKSFTSLEQSRKLAEILPLESADMYYREWKRMTKHISIAHVGSAGENDLPCWSLAALLNVLPNGNMLVKTTDGKYYCIVKDIMTKHYDNPIDACYETIKEMFKI